MSFHVGIPPIKSQGIKTKLVPAIQSLVPENFGGKWIEPFMGTGAVAFNVAPREALLCDANPHLINFYQAIQRGEINAAMVKEHLSTEGETLLNQGEAHYYFIRERFNHTHSPLDFLFLNRACFNGMIRFNQKGGFNVPFCRKPQRFAKAYVTKISNQVAWVAKVMTHKAFTFKCQSFAETIQEAAPNDLIYCDPPYIDRHADYYNGWHDKDERDLFVHLSDFNGKFILSTWHHNDFRQNAYIEALWAEFQVLTREHFYHVGGKEKNRNPMIEALITNFSTANTKPSLTEIPRQFNLFEQTTSYDFPYATI